MGSAPASGASNRALAVGLGQRDVLQDGGSVFGKRVFREGSEDGSRGACAPYLNWITSAAHPWFWI